MQNPRSDRAKRRAAYMNVPTGGGETPPRFAPGSHQSSSGAHAATRASSSTRSAASGRPSRPAASLPLPTASALLSLTSCAAGFPDLLRGVARGTPQTFNMQTHVQEPGEDCSAFGSRPPRAGAAQEAQALVRRGRPRICTEATPKRAGSGRRLGERPGVLGSVRGQATGGPRDLGAARAFRNAMTSWMAALLCCALCIEGTCADDAFQYPSLSAHSVSERRRTVEHVTSEFEGPGHHQYRGEHRMRQLGRRGPRESGAIHPDPFAIAWHD